MKKIISLLLCVALLFSMVVVVAHADEVPAASFANAATVPGGFVKIDMNIANNPGLAAIKLVIADVDGLGATFEGVDNEEDTLGLTANDGAATYFWSTAFNNYNATIGTLIITVPNDAKLGDYNFTVTASQGGNEDLQKVAVANTTFKITVTDKVITGVNVAIDAGLAIGVHVNAADPDEASIVAVDRTAKEYTIVDDYVEDEENGGYIFYLNVNPWDMNKTFTVDFLDNVVIDEETDELDMSTLSAGAVTTGILDYCTKVKGMSDELDQLIADMLAYGQKVQAYKGLAEMAMPEGLTASEGAWEVVDPEDGEATIPATFGDYCIENYTPEYTKGNNTAAKKFKFDEAKIEIGAKFAVKFKFANNGTKTAASTARLVIDGETVQLTVDEDDTNIGYYTYAFSPLQYSGVSMVLYATSVSNTNKCYTTQYGPATYAAFCADGGAGDDLMDVLEAFYLYGLSVEAYLTPAEG